jgi:hypothetical protein
MTSSTANAADRKVGVVDHDPDVEAFTALIVDVIEDREALCAAVDAVDERAMRFYQG